MSPNSQLPKAPQHAEASPSEALQDIVGILMEQGKREEQIMAKMKNAVEAGNRELVFTLASELTCQKNRTGE